jgi:hypothetical protein
VGTLTEGQGSVQLTSSLRQLVLFKKLNKFSIFKAAHLKVNCTEPSPSVRTPWLSFQLAHKFQVFEDLMVVIASITLSLALPQIGIDKWKVIWVSY